MNKGIVKWYRKGYGFIAPIDGNGADVFLHHSNILDADAVKTLKRGDIVTYYLEEREGKPLAVNIKRLYSVRSVNEGLNSRGYRLKRVTEDRRYWMVTDMENTVLSGDYGITLEEAAEWGKEGK